MAVCRQDKSIYKQILGSNAIRGSETAACSIPAGSFCIWRVCELLLAALEWLKLYLSDWLQLSCLLQVQIPKWGHKLVMYKSWTSLLQASSQVPILSNWILINFIKKCHLLILRFKAEPYACGMQRSQKYNVKGMATLPEWGWWTYKWSRPAKYKQSDLWGFISLFIYLFVCYWILTFPM